MGAVYVFDVFQKKSKTRRETQRRDKELIDERLLEAQRLHPGCHNSKCGVYAASHIKHTNPVWFPRKRPKNTTPTAVLTLIRESVATASILNASEVQRRGRTKGLVAVSRRWE